MKIFHSKVRCMLLIGILIQPTFLLALGFSQVLAGVLAITASFQGTTSIPVSDGATLAGPQAEPQVASQAVSWLPQRILDLKASSWTCKSYYPFIMSEATNPEGTGPCNPGAYLLKQSKDNPVISAGRLEGLVKQYGYNDEYISRTIDIYVNNPDKDHKEQLRKFFGPLGYKCVFRSKSKFQVDRVYESNSRGFKKIGIGWKNDTLTQGEAQKDFLKWIRSRNPLSDDYNMRREDTIKLYQKGRSLHFVTVNDAFSTPEG